MKGLKEFFRMIITAVVCFGAKLFGGNKKGVVKVCTEKGNTFFLTGREGSWNLPKSEGKDFIRKNRNLGLKSRSTLERKGRNLLYPYSRQNLPLKEVMPWKQGPGDRNEELHKNKSPSRIMILEEIRGEGIYLAPE